MATMNNCSLLTDKSSANSNNFYPAHDAQQFSNLNLNQGFKSTIVSSSSVQSYNKSSTDKQLAGFKATDSNLIPKHEGKRKSESFLTDLCSKSTNFVVDINDKSEDEAKKQWKKDTNSSSTMNNSTLSLHIIAYENSIEASNDFADAESKNLKEEKSIKKWKSVKQSGLDSASLVQNSFEFPRQQKDLAATDPEVMQFKASQKLLNPDQPLPSDQQNNPKPEMAEVESTTGAAAQTIGGGEVSYPLKVVYCGACSMPLEYCEYSNCKDACREWLEKNLPNLAGDISIGDGGDEKKHQKRGGKGTSSGGGKGKKQQEPAKVTLQLSARSKNKNVTLVKGLATFGVDLKVASKVFSSKFACGCSVTGADEITIQGDFSDQLFDLIPEKWKQIDEDSIEDLGGEANAKR